MEDGFYRTLYSPLKYDWEAACPDKEGAVVELLKNFTAEEVNYVKFLTIYEGKFSETKIRDFLQPQMIVDCIRNAALCHGEDEAEGYLEDVAEEALEALTEMLEEWVLKVAGKPSWLNMVEIKAVQVDVPDKLKQQFF